MLCPMLFGLVLLATLQQFIPANAAPPASNATASTHDNSTASSLDTTDTPGSTSATLVATANLTGNFNVTGQFQFALQSGTGPVAVSLEINGLNTLNSSLMYAYHIHTNPISSDGNCSSALAHLDPLAVTEALICSPQMGKYCQEGDLSGRNGKLSATDPTTKAAYVDHYLRFWPQPFTILGRSVVVHLPNSTRIACGNITSVVDGTATPGGLPTFRSSNYTTQFPTHPPPPTPIKYQPFNGTNVNSTVLSEITLPSPLPTVEEMPNIILGSNATNATLPAALNASTPFSYTPGAVLPSQNDTSIFNNNNSSQASTSIKKAASNGVGTLSPSMFLNALIALGFVAFI